MCESINTLGDRSSEINSVVTKASRDVATARLPGVVRANPLGVAGVPMACGDCESGLIT